MAMFGIGLGNELWKMTGGRRVTSPYRKADSYSKLEKDYIGVLPYFT